MVTGIFPGEEGSLCQEALNNFFTEKETSFNASPMKNTTSVAEFEDVFKLVMSTPDSIGIVPMDNSTTGVFKETYDSLQKYKVHIVGEWYQMHDLCLCAKVGTTLEDITEVHSHPAVLASCKNFLLSSKLPTVQCNSTSTALAAVGECKDAEGNQKCVAAIASVQAAEERGLVILKDPVSDDEHLTSRFVLISKEKLPACLQGIYQVSKSWKCSMAIDLVDKPGAILRALSLISFKDLNIEKIQTFPLNKAERRHFEYWLYLDFNPSSLSQAQAISEQMLDYATEVKNFGVFPCHQWEDKKTKLGMHRTVSFSNGMGKRVNKFGSQQDLAALEAAELTAACAACR